MIRLLAIACLCTVSIVAPFTSLVQHARARPLSRPGYGSHFSVTALTDADMVNDTETTSVVAANSAIDPKEAVKVFGRLAEKYIALDSSGGMCCYSACTNCEFRLPGGGYVMADQSAARPKWIPHYESRNSNNRDHITKWSTGVFVQGPSVSKDEFVRQVAGLDYAPPLGGPYVGASTAKIDDTAVLEHLFDLLADGKTKLTRNRMSIRLKQLSNGEEGMTWQAFERVMGLV
jgi:hypothetical protein